jgi:hypothetical protein
MLSWKACFATKSCLYAQIQNVLLQQNWGINFGGSTFTENRKCEMILFFRWSSAWLLLNFHFSTFTGRWGVRRCPAARCPFYWALGIFSFQLKNPNLKDYCSLQEVREWPFNRTPIRSSFSPRFFGKGRGRPKGYIESGRSGFFPSHTVNSCRSDCRIEQTQSSQK